MAKGTDVAMLLHRNNFILYCFLHVADIIAVRVYATVHPTENSSKKSPSECLPM